jgi:UDP-N-acetyl-D-glucosamine dehydrogenase
MNTIFLELRKKIKRRSAKVAVIGLGYVGLPLALEFAKKGFHVLGLEVDRDRLACIKRRESYITDITTEELRKVMATGRFSAINDFRSIKYMDCIIICVPTPLKRKYYPDISYIKSAVNSVSENIKKGSLVILESTTYPGTTEEVILPILESKHLIHDKDFYLCFSPERIDPGNQEYPVNKIPKVLGGLTEDATCLGKLLYQNIVDKVVPVSSARVAETVKLLENTFRIVNIGLIDEIAMMAHKMDIDIWEIIDAAKTKPFGFMPFYPGPGVGGHCIPKDPLYLYWKAKRFGFESRFIKLSSQIITFMPKYVVERLGEILNGQGKSLKQARLLVVGVTYKKDVKDLRKSPSLDIIELLQDRKVKVSYYDPLIPYLQWNGINLESISLTGQNLKKFDCVIIATDHSGVDYRFILRNSRLIFDTRNIYKGIRDEKIIRL